MQEPNGLTSEQLTCHSAMMRDEICNLVVESFGPVFYNANLDFGFSLYIGVGLVPIQLKS